MTPAPQQAPKEYICNDDDLGCLYDYMMAAMAGDDISELPRLWNQEIGVIKSRPHPAPAERKVCCASCPCREPNCEDDCPEWVANNALLTAQINDAVKAAARAAREDERKKVLDEIAEPVCRAAEESCHNGDVTSQMCFEEVLQIVASLRGERE